MHKTASFLSSTPDIGEARATRIDSGLIVLQKDIVIINKTRLMLQGDTGYLCAQGESLFFMTVSFSRFSMTCALLCEAVA